MNTEDNDLFDKVETNKKEVVEYFNYRIQENLREIEEWKKFIKNLIE